MDLLESLEIPQTPWPLVQPLPSFAPTPTNNPEIMRAGLEESIDNNAKSGSREKML